MLWHCLHVLVSRLLPHTRPATFSQIRYVSRPSHLLQVVKAASGKFHPLHQWFYFDSIESLPDEPLSAEEVAPEVRFLVAYLLPGQNALKLQCVRWL